MTNRKTLKIDPDLADRLKELKRDGETWNGLLARAADKLENDQPGGPSYPACEQCGAVLQEWTRTEDGKIMCFDCAGIDRSEALPES